MSENSIFNLTEYLIIASAENGFTGDSLNPVPVSYDKFESYIKSHTESFDEHLTINMNPRSILFLIKLKNNIVYDISFVFTP